MKLVEAATGVFISPYNPATLGSEQNAALGADGSKSVAAVTAVSQTGSASSPWRAAGPDGEALQG